MGNKNGFDPSITRGIQVCWIAGERVTVVHPHGYLENVPDGECVLFETRRDEDQRMYWFGRVGSTAYWLSVEKPVTIFEVSSWLRVESPADEFCDLQGELPF
jgi:hypothetical protein